jgi:glutaminyl-tRNA synthetase
MAEPPPKFFRLAPGREVRLRYAYLITCRQVETDAAGEARLLRCTYDPASRGGDAPDGRRVKGTLHWVSVAHAVPAEVRLYDHLLMVAEPGTAGDFLADLNSRSLEILSDCRLEPSLAGGRASEAVQFERQGYFCRDPDSRPERLVFNRTVPLRDTWARLQSKGA